MIIMLRLDCVYFFSETLRYIINATFQINGQGLYKLDGGGKIQCLYISGTGSGGMRVTLIDLTITNGNSGNNVSNVLRKIQLSSFHLY